MAVPSTRTKMPMTSGIATVKTLPMRMLWESTHSDSASNGPRVMPEPGKWDARELAYYDDVVATLRQNATTPMITLMHWVYPGWGADRGGLMDNLDAFASSAKVITKRYAGQGVLWVSINEPGPCTARLNRIRLLHRNGRRQPSLGPGHGRAVEYQPSARRHLLRCALLRPTITGVADLHC